MKLFKIIFIGTLFVAFSSIVISAQNDMSQSSGSSSSSSSMSATGTGQGTGEMLSAKDLIGSDVKSSDGEKVGTVKEIIGDNSQDKVKYVVIDSDKLHPVPWSACSVAMAEEPKKHHKDMNEPNKPKHHKMHWKRGSSEKQGELTVDMTKDQLRSAPTVSSLDIDNFTNSSLQQQVDSYYSKFSTSTSSSMPGTAGTQQMSQASTSQAGTNLFRASHAIGMKVNDTQDKKLGSIKDIAVDSERGNLAFGLVSFGGTMKGKIAAVPWSSLNVDTSKKTASLNASSDKLDSAVLENGDISKLSDRQFASQIYQSFGAQPYWGVYGYEPSGNEKSKPMDANKPGMKDHNEPNKM